MYFERFRTYTGKLYNRFFKIRGNPGEVASGFAMGIFIGLTPFFGLHIVISLFLAAVLKCSKIAAVTGVQITNIFTAPFFYSITYWVGSKAIGYDFSSNLHMQFTLDTVIHLFSSAPMILWSLTFGGIIVGIPLAGVVYVTTYYICRHIKIQHQLKAREKIN